MAQYGGEQYGRKEEGYGGEQYGRKEEGYGHGQKPGYSSTEGYNVGGMGGNHHSATTGYNVGGGVAGQGYEEGKHGGGGFLHRTGSGSSSSSESDGEGGRRKKKGLGEKIKEKLPGGDHGGDEYKNTSNIGSGGGYGYDQGSTEGHEKKGIMDKIKEKLPGGH
ncbi:uncharacterized protein LOC143538027 [Bidens hawaiensis]|uniref:uncharacterized protein LOC143538027 n=1 Tax=Bidens hawaiensis TaxID=980011 RepID=UPI00404A70F4